MRAEADATSAKEAFMMRWDHLLHGDYPHAVGLGTRAMLVSLTMGGLAMLGWRLLQMRRAAGFDRRALAPAHVNRGRTIYRNTPLPPEERYL
jgi:hypothetical protein